MKIMQNASPSPPRPHESGNIFFLIILGVALFAALMYSFSRGAREGQGNVSDRQADIAASDILAYAQSLERAVAGIQRLPYSESQISFRTGNVSGYHNTDCSDSECHIFNEYGGPLTWLAPPQNINNGNWVFNANNVITGAGCDTANSSCTDLTAILPNLDLNVCLKINDRLSITNPGGMPPEDDNNMFNETAKFTGAFTYTNTLASSGGELDGQNTGCFTESADIHHFYHVLKAR